jgi:hypothetical protein
VSTKPAEGNAVKESSAVKNISKNDMKKLADGLEVLHKYWPCKSWTVRLGSVSYDPESGFFMPLTINNEQVKSSE